MPNKWKTTSDTPPRSMSAALLDFVFGAPLPQPKVPEHGNQQTWQEWLDAKAGQETVIEFEDTEPVDDEADRQPAARN